MRGFLCVLGLAACGTTPTDDAVRTFDPCARTAIDATQASPEQSASVDHAIASWRQLGMTGLAREAAPGISIVFRDASSAFYGYYDDEDATVYINERLDSDHARAVAIAHELGHALGLGHIPASVRPSVMNIGNVTITPTAEDAAEIVALWGACP